MTLKVAGVDVGTESVTLAAEASTTVSFTVSKDTEGTYSVEVDGLTDSFTVTTAPPEPPEPAEFELSNLQVSPSDVEPDEEVTISITVENVGEESGSYSVTLELDGAPEDMESVTLDGGASATVTFTVATPDEGSHTVEVDGLEGSFTVTAPPPPPPPPRPFPWVWVGVAVIVIVAAAAYYYYLQKRGEDESFISFWRQDQK